MGNFLSWFYELLGRFFGGIWTILKGFGLGLFNIFNVKAYYDLFKKYASEFSAGEWIVTILLFLLFLALLAALIYVIVLVVRKFFRYHRVVQSNEDLLKELSGLHRDIARLNLEKEQIMRMKTQVGAISKADLNDVVENVRKELDEIDVDELVAKGETAVTVVDDTASAENAEKGNGEKRFYRLCAVDEKRMFEVAPNYVNDFDLNQLCENFRNFACGKMGLYYDIKTIRLMFAGLASTKLILLQGISGTGKTSLPYAMGKYFKNDATIASVQPSWRDRTELFGYFNEFTKRFNETEVLKRVYESSYNDDINIVVLDEMNIARVEYYFAEMLSILEMPNPDEWKISLVPNAWPGDPVKLEDGQLKIPQNIWYIGTANNDDSTFSVSDKVYDRAFTINLDSKGIPFEAEPVEATEISYTYVTELYKKALDDFPVSDDMLTKIAQLDNYVINHFRIAFGNRIMKQLSIFVPVYVACGGDAVDGLDYLLATKVIRKFESLNIALIRDEIDPFINYLDKLFGKNSMGECIRLLKRIRKMY